MKFTTESAPKPLPFTVNVNAAAPAAMLVGLIEVTTGGGLIVNVTALEVAPPEVSVTETVPGVAMRLAGTGAVT